MPEASRSFPLQDNWEFLLLSVIFGVSVGVTEIVARYKDEPLRATLSAPGVVYFLVNGAVSAAAYFLVVYYRGKVFSSLGEDKLLASIGAGFGAMVIMRSKLFSFKSEGGESYAVGPDAVLSTVLSSVDRQIDRGRSSRRRALVNKTLPQTEDVAGAIHFIRTSLASYQILSDVEKKTLGDVISEVEKQTDLSPRLKLMAISFGLLNISGEANYRKLMGELSNHLGLTPRP